MHIKITVLTLFAIASLAVAIACGETALADEGMASAHYRVPWSALTAGSQGMSSSAFTMQGSLSYGTTANAASSGFSLNSGFWSGWLALLRDSERVYLPLVLRDR